MTSRNLDEEAMKHRLLPWTIAGSLLLHGVAYASLGAAPAKGPGRHKKSVVSFEVTRPARPVSPPPTASPEPAQPKPEPPKAKPKAAPAPPATTPATAPPPTSQPPVAEAPASPGITLAGEGTGNAFSMPLGSGGSLEPTHVPAIAPAPLNSVPPVTPAPRAPGRSEPTLVAVGDLSTRPSAPPLAGDLERNYPADARRRGLSGTAKVRARIDPDGVVRRVTLLEESAAGFGAACSRTVNGSRWGAPKDQAGHSVATEIRYTCRFVVQP
jgi:TonB family protein